MNMRERLAGVMQGNVVVMGIGNPCRGDDAAGSLVARRIRGAPGVRVIDAQDVPEDYVTQAVNQRPDTVVLVDSVDLKSAPGAVALLDKDQIAAYWPSTHRVPLSLLIDYLERETRARVYLIAIQPRHTAFMQPLSGEVRASVAGVVDVLKSVLERPWVSADGGCAHPSKRKAAT
jgi:hydrogenase 3 maturation protease